MGIETSARPAGAGAHIGDLPARQRLAVSVLVSVAAFAFALLLDRLFSDIHGGIRCRLDGRVDWVSFWEEPALSVLRIMGAGIPALIPLLAWLRRRDSLFMILLVSLGMWLMVVVSRLAILLHLICRGMVIWNR